ncbi:hypothetical protein ACWEVY_10025 [Streptomyces longwoodensis]
MITGTLSGLRTRGLRVSECQPGRPRRIGRAAQRAVALLCVTTMSTGSQPYLAYKYDK